VPPPLQVSLADIGASLPSHCNLESELNFRTNEQTLSVSSDDALDIGATVLMADIGMLNLNRHRAVDFVFDENGELKGANLRRTFTPQEFLAGQSELENLYGQAFEASFITTVEQSDEVTVNFSLRPEALAELKQQLAGASPEAIAQSAVTLLKASMPRPDILVKPGGVIATNRTDFTVGLDVEVAFIGPQIGLRGSATIGHEQEIQA
jgi:hypothetical protein